MKLTKLIFAFGLLTLLAFTSHFGRSANNGIRGSVKFFECPKKVKKGTGYNKDGTEIMHSDDPMAKTKQNLILSLHPITFKPALSPTENAYITQKEQTFLPHVLPVTVGSKVHFLNEDEFFHNVQSLSKQRFSIGRRAPGISYSQKIYKTGAISLMCDIHSQMNGVILALDTPYFTRVKSDGTFELGNLPDGKYRLELYHPTCTAITDEIMLQGGKVYNLKYDFTVKP
ncbi:MAG: hypothetical protein EP344_18070 [Bacteroidetes bacterium]|nr:MAG: hypothetical protein EP344_18070 [Bacteroidota bacterium]